MSKFTSKSLKLVLAKTLSGRFGTDKPTMRARSRFFPYHYLCGYVIMKSPFDITDHLGMKYTNVWEVICSVIFQMWCSKQMVTNLVWMWP